MTERAGVTMPLPSLHHLAPRRCVPVAGVLSTLRTSPCDEQSDAGARDEDEDTRLKKLREKIKETLLKKLNEIIENADLTVDSKKAVNSMLNSQTPMEEWVQRFTTVSVNPKHTAIREAEPLATLPFWDAPPLLHLWLLYQVQLEVSPLVQLEVSKDGGGTSSLPTESATMSRPDFKRTVLLVRCKMVKQIMNQGLGIAKIFKLGHVDALKGAQEEVLAECRSKFIPTDIFRRLIDNWLLRVDDPTLTEFVKGEAHNAYPEFQAAYPTLQEALELATIMYEKSASLRGAQFFRACHFLGDLWKKRLVENLLTNEEREDYEDAVKAEAEKAKAAKEEMEQKIRKDNLRGLGRSLLKEDAEENARKKQAAKVAKGVKRGGGKAKKGGK